MEKILVSACLLGAPVRYNGEAQTWIALQLRQWQSEGRLLPVCPEIAGGLPVPRPPAEQQADGRILTQQGADVSVAFKRGAEHTLAQALQHGIKLAVLKARSPSCGVDQIYDGQFRQQLIAGDGVTAALLKAHQIEVFSEYQLDACAERLQALEIALNC